MEFDYIHEDMVRDYECDLQGIVNNANYLHYTEHTRHEFLRHYGISFAAMHAEGCDAVVARCEIAYKSPLKSLDKYLSCVKVEKNGVRYVFNHFIYRKSDKVLCVKAKVDVVCLVNGVLVNSYPIVDELLQRITLSQKYKI
jgi:acyl-CoA thioester hydrolase